MLIKLVLLVAFFGSMIGVGFYCRRHTTDVNGFVLGGRSVGPWLTAFAYGTSYFSAVVFIAISVVLAIIQYKSSVTFIAQLMGVSWGALAGAFLAPFLFGLYWKKTTCAACWTNFLFSTVFMLANIFVKSSFPVLLQSPINAGAFCMIAGLVLVPVVSLFTKKPDTALVEDAFSCYDKKVLVPQRDALGESKSHN